MAKTVTAKQVESLRTPGKVLSHSLGTGGSLIIRRLAKSTALYYQYRHDGRMKRYPFGVFDITGNSTGRADCMAFTLVGARKRAEALSELAEQVGDLAEHFSREKEKAEREHQQAERDAASYSLRRLCMAYADHQQAQGKESACRARQLLDKWVIQKHPRLAAKIASEIATDDIMVILRTVIDSGLTTTTNRVRSYLMAAYNYGIGSATDPLASAQSSGFNLTMNPVSPTKRVAKFERAGHRVLTVSELAELLHRLQATDKPAAKAMLLSLRLGGQRIRQLLAAQDYNPDTKTVTILDTKGRRTEPRRHILPVVERAQPLLFEGMAIRHPQRTGLWAGLTQYTVSNLVTGLSRAMEADSGTPPFSLRDLRRTVETMLAAMGISKDLRAQIQSHGLSGVQDRHYDRHHYLPEKKQALAAWNSRLDEMLSGAEQASNVVTLTR